MCNLKAVLRIFSTMGLLWVSQGAGGFFSRADDTLVIERFPAEVGNSWEYSRFFRVVMYDTVNNDTTTYMRTDSLHEGFQAIDTLAGWECYRLRHVLFQDGDSFPETWWYAHPDTALLWIAYAFDYSLNLSHHPTTDVRLWLGGLSFSGPEALESFLRHQRVRSATLDTSYWDPPKKLFIFPLQIGAQWVAMTNPWLEEREAVEEDSVSVPAGDFYGLRIAICSEWMGPTDAWWNWLATQGIIKDSLHIRGVMTDPYGNVIGYFLGDDIYELVGLNMGIQETPSCERGVTYSIQIYPNPFAHRLTIRCNTPRADLSASIYDVSGSLLRTLKKGPLGPFCWTATWDGRDNNGKRVPPGVYFCRVDVALAHPPRIHKLVFIR